MQVFDCIRCDRLFHNDINEDIVFKSMRCIKCGVLCYKASSTDAEAYSIMIPNNKEGNE